MIKEWLESYHPVDRDQATAALREIMQEVALAGLYRAAFYEKAAFYGGTALRIFYGLDRFSEDLDFSVREKTKTIQSNVESAFLKSETIWKELVLDGVLPQQGLGQVANIKIKLEVDKRPPLGFDTEEKLLTRPFSFYVKCFTLPDLFAGKMHALLFRRWQNNVKGRDWYDMEWYIKKGIPLNLSHFLQRAIGSGNWKKNTITEAEFRDLLSDKIDTVNMNRVKEDISRFIPDQDRLKIWSPQYFHDLAGKLKIEHGKENLAIIP
jgi:hypothetical protein